MKLTFTTWALSQFTSLVTALAKNSRVQEDCDNPSAEFIADLLGDMDNASSNSPVEGISLGNFIFTYDKKTRKTSILNVRNDKYVTTHCNLNDFMSVKVGLGICWAKYNNVERPKFPVLKNLSELKPHDIFSMYSYKRKYEFIGTTNEHTKGDVKYVGYALNNKNGQKEFATFFEDTCTVWE